MDSHFRTRTDRQRDHREMFTGIDAAVTVFHDDTTTEARVTVTAKDGAQFYGEGFAFLSPGDHYDPTVGEQLAVTRAMRNSMDDMEAYIIEHSQTEEEFLAENTVEDADEDIPAFLDEEYEAAVKRRIADIIAKFDNAPDEPKREGGNGCTRPRVGTDNETTVTPRDFTLTYGPISATGYSDPLTVGRPLYAVCHCFDCS